MNILVTGAAGFIGSNMADFLLNHGHKVFGVDNFRTGHKKYIEQALRSPNFIFIEADLLKGVPNFDEKIDLVIHLAANADIRGGLQNSTIDFELNTLITVKLLEYMRNKSINRLVYASSAAAIGEPSVFPTPENIPVTQTSLYGASKMASECFIQAYASSFGIVADIYRFVSLLGPRYPHGHVIDFVKQLTVEGKDFLTILGDGTQRKSYLHVEDCIDAINTISIESIGNGANIYNLGYPAYCTVNDSAGWIISELGLNVEKKFTGGDRGWVGDNPFVFLDVTKAQKTGWIPLHKIEESVRETVRWILRNEWILKA